ncbi:MAG TPA: sugar ABC transporter permease [Anaerolineae bacterium]|nr:sugar ABC transporter permease [Anaerolineae bacterium]
MHRTLRLPHARSTSESRPRSFSRLIPAALFLLPGLILFATFVVVPMLYSFRISFYEWNIVKPETSTWVGLENYTRALNDPIFRKAVLNTLLYAAVTVPGQIMIGLAVAVLLDQRIRARAFFRVVYYLPVISSWVIVSLLFEYMFSGQRGLINYVLRDVLHVTQENIRWLADPILVFVPIHLLAIWKGVGWTAIILLAGLQSIPEHLHEAAAVDGAGPLARFRRITLPLLRPTLVFLIVVLTIGGLNAYISFLLMTDGGDPLDQAHSVLTLMYEATFTKLEFGYGSAISYLLTVFVFVVSIFQIRLLRKRVEV